jgi:hypothetical protein
MGIQFIVQKMKLIKQLSIFNICLLLIFILIPQQVSSQDERGNEYRITLFPSHKITENITGFAYLGYVWNPEKNYQTYYLGYPAACYAFKPWLQVWGGLVGLYTNNESTSDKLELRPFVGPKFFLPNELKWNIYNFTRYEFRATQDRETKDWNNYSRLRSRFGIEFPISSLENAWQPGKFYGLADVEPYYRFDKGQFDPVRIRGGLGYILKKAPLRVEFIYHMQLTNPDAATGLRFTDNIFRINIKLGLNKGIVNKLNNPDID